MQITIAVSAPNKPEREVKISNDVVVGRGATANLRIISNEVSREHCRLIVSDERVAVRDLGSSNGTQLDGRTIETGTDVLLRSGSRLDIGPLKLIVRFDISKLPQSFAEALQAQKAAADSVVESATVSTVLVPELAVEELAEPAYGCLEETDLTEIEESNATIDLAELADTVAITAEELEAEPDDETEFASLPETEAADEPMPVVDEPPAKRKGLFGLFRRDKKAAAMPESETDSAIAPPAKETVPPQQAVAASTSNERVAAVSPAAKPAPLEPAVAESKLAANVPATDVGLFPPDQDADWETEYAENAEFEDEQADDDVDPGFAKFLNGMN